MSELPDLETAEGRRVAEDMLIERGWPADAARLDRAWRLDGDGLDLRIEWRRLFRRLDRPLLHELGCRFAEVALDSHPQLPGEVRVPVAAAIAAKRALLAELGEAERCLQAESALLELGRSLELGSLDETMAVAVCSAVDTRITAEGLVEAVELIRLLQDQDPLGPREVIGPLDRALFAETVRLMLQRGPLDS